MAFPARMLGGGVRLHRRAVHSCSRYSRSWRTACREPPLCVSFKGGLPLSEEEQTQLLTRTQRIGLEKPELARAMLRQLEEGDAQIKKPMKSLSTMEKIAGAKLQRMYGRGKTALFAYLSDVDKARVLHFTKADGADEIAGAKMGRTAFFAALPGEVKYAALRDWQLEREACQNTVRVGEQGPENPDGRFVPPPKLELFRLSLSQGVPMTGFGFADNFLMITFGGTIDAYFGLYVSLMAAAGLGNLCSNIVGLGLADYIEYASSRLGVPVPKLSPAQRETPQARLASFAGTACGVTTGCLLGMAPLWFMDTAAGSDAEEGQHRGV